MHHKYTARLYAPILLLLCSMALKAQTWQDSLAMRFDSLQPYVQTGYLYDRYPLAAFADSAYTTNPALFNQMPPVPVNYSLFYKMVSDFRWAAYDSTALPSYTQLQAIDFSQRQLADVPIGVLQLNYQKLHEYAADSGWVRYDTIIHKYLPMPDSTRIIDTVYDGNGQIIGIIDTTFYNNPDSLMALALPVHPLFLATTLPNAWGVTSLQTPVNFSLPQSLYFSNVSSGFTLQIDFGDGFGFRNFTQNQTINITYGSFGKKLIKIRFDISGWQGGELPEAHFYLTLYKSAPPPDNEFLISELNVLAPCDNLRDDGFGVAEGAVTIRYADPTYKKRLNRHFSG